MLKLNKNKYPEQSLSIDDFILMISGHAIYEDLKVTDNSGHQSSYITGNLTVQQQLEVKDIYEPLKESLYSLSMSLSRGFPDTQQTIRTWGGERKNTQLYLASDLITFCIEQWDDFPKLNLAPWVKEYIYQSHYQQKSDLGTVKSGYVELDKLPKKMQFLLECHAEPSYQVTHINNKNSLLKNFKPEVVEQIVELSKNKGITSISQRKEIDGLTKTQAEQFFDLIQNK